MTLTNRTDFAFRTLMYLAALTPPATRATSGAIATAFGISTNHLVKVVNELARGGYIHTSRGIGGGIELAVAPEDIRLGEFIENFQGSVTLHECTSTPGICAIQSFCKLKGILAQADELQAQFLDRFTLADIIPAQTKMAALKP